MSLEEYKARRARLGFAIAPKPVAPFVPPPKSEKRIIDDRKVISLVPKKLGGAPKLTGYEVAELVYELELSEYTPILPRYIKRKVAEKFRVTVEELVGHSRINYLVWARQVAIWLCMRYSCRSYSSIGRSFNRDHATCIYACTTVEGRPWRSHDAKS